MLTRRRDEVVPGLVLLCGRTFSGKSTVAGQLADGLPGMIISLDGINAERGLWGGDGVPVEEWAHTMDLAHDRVSEAVRQGATVIIDDTSSPAFLRDSWRERAAALAVPLVLVYVHVDEATLRERLHRNRSAPQRGDISDEVLAEHLASFEPPTAAEAALIVNETTDSAVLVDAVRDALTAAAER